MFDSMLSSRAQVKTVATKIPKHPNEYSIGIWKETDFFHCVPFLWKFNIADEFYLQIFQSQEIIPQVESAIQINIHIFGSNVESQTISYINEIICITLTQNRTYDLILFCSFYDWSFLEQPFTFTIRCSLYVWIALGKPIKQKKNDLNENENRLWIND